VRLPGYGCPACPGSPLDTFQLTDEGREEPRETLSEALRLAGVAAASFVAAEPGQVFDFDDPAA